MEYEVIFRCNEHNRDLKSPYGIKLRPNNRNSSNASFNFGFTELYCASDDYDGESELPQCQEHWYVELNH